MRWTVNLSGGPQLVNHAGVSWNKWIFSIGGYNSSFPEEYDDWYPLLVYRLNTDTLRWQKCPYPPKDIDGTSSQDFSSMLCQRYGHTVVFYEDRFYMWGGRNNHTIFNALHCFDPETLQWSYINTRGPHPPPADGHSACVIDDKMFIFGGYEYYNVFFTNFVYYFNFKEWTWSLVYPNGTPPSPRDFHSAIAIGSKMYVYGGRSCENDNENFYDPNIKYLDTNTITWYDVDAHGDIPEPRRSHSAWLYKDEMYIFGGYNETLEKHYNDLYKFSPKTNTWTRLNIPGETPKPRRRQVCINLLDKVYLFGGTSPAPNLEEVLVTEDSEEPLIDLHDLHILDYKPTLKVLCIEVVLKHNLDTSNLPEVIRWDIEIMTTPNKITSSN